MPARVFESRTASSTFSDMRNSLSCSTNAVIIFRSAKSRLTELLANLRICRCELQNLNAFSFTFFLFFFYLKFISFKGLLRYFQSNLGTIKVFVSVYFKNFNNFMYERFTCKHITVQNISCIYIYIYIYTKRMTLCFLHEDGILKYICILQNLL